MNFHLTSFVLSVIATSTPLLLAATGELITEKSGVLNLGLEGLMLIGAIAGFAAAYHSGSALVGVLVGGAAGAALACVFAVLTLNFLSNQVATGLALAIFGTGLSALAGSSYVGIAVTPLPALDVPGLTDLPVIGPILFGQNALVYFSFLALGAVAWFLTRSRGGLIVRAVGDSHDAAHALGYSVVGIRYLATMFGGLMSGLAGAYLSLAYSPSWAENMTAGRGWIALALVVFSTWRPLWLLVGAYLFGSIMYLSFYIQGLGLAVPSQAVASLPYLATIAVLVLISRDRVRVRLNAPACLGQPFHEAG